MNMMGGAFSNVTVAEKANSPYAVMFGLALLNAIALLVAAGIFSQSACKDFDTKTANILFSFPIHRQSFFIGRWVSAAIVSGCIMLSLGLGYAVGEMMPWLNRENLLPFNLLGYLYTYSYLILPNLLIFGCFYFGVGLLTRRTVLVYLTGVALFVGSTILGNVLIDFPTLVAVLDPTGSSALAIGTKLWTSVQRETQLPPIQAEFWVNRFIWLTFSFGFVGWNLLHLSIAPQSSRPAKVVERSADIEQPSLVLAPVRQSFDPLLQWHYVVSQTWVEFRTIAGNRWFLFALALAIVPPILISGISFGAVYATPLYPLTHLLVDQASGLYAQLFRLLLIFLAGEMIWRDRQVQVQRLTDVLPIRSFVPLLSKYFALALIMLSALMMVMASCLLVQTLSGYTRYEFGVYFTILFTKLFPELLIVAALSFLIQVAVQNLYLGYLMTALVLFVLPQALSQFNLASIFIYGSTPAAPYSQFDGFGAALVPLRTFQGYWSAWTILLLAIALLLWQRGEDTDWRSRLQVVMNRWNRPLQRLMLGTLTIVVVLGGWLYYNTHILNPTVSQQQVEISRVNYERMFKRIGVAQPQVEDIQLRYELYPQQRRLQATGEYRLVNKTRQPIEQVLVNLNLDHAAKVNQMSLGTVAQPLQSQTLNISPDFTVAVRAFKLPKPLLPGEAATLNFDLSWQPKPGFGEFGQDYGLSTNGTSLDGILPAVAYEPGAELDDPKKRSHYNLPPLPETKTIAQQIQSVDRTLPPTLTTWTVTVGTSKDQTAVVPGLLQREWTEGNRRYFQYRMDRPVMLKMPLYSARYEVKREQWKDLPIEVYYLKGHEFNVDRLIRATQASLDYYTQNFSPTTFGQVRIFEMPREQYAVSLPGTIGFAEYIGFLAKIDDKNPENVDYPSYVTAHEVAHQWWAHQLVPDRRIQGSRTMDEMLAQYSALMVMEKLYGEDTIRRILKYELKSYFNDRAGSQQEQPLMTSFASSVVYRKGAVAMYALKQAIGEEKLNAALGKYLRDHSATSLSVPPFPIILDLIEAIRSATPGNLQFLVSDWLENITIYDAQAKQATVTKRPDGSYEVTLTATLQKFQSDEEGNEKAIELNPQETVEIGILGEDDQWLYRQAHKLQTGSNTVTIVVDREPKRVMVDPFYSLPNRSFENATIAPSIAASN